MSELVTNKKEKKDFGGLDIVGVLIEPLTPTPLLPHGLGISPEHELWTAVLWEAFENATDPLTSKMKISKPRKKRPANARDNRWKKKERELDRDDARAWIASEANYVGSFTFVCDVLGLNVEWVRAGLTKLIEQGRRIRREDRLVFTLRKQIVPTRVDGLERQLFDDEGYAA